MSLGERIAGLLAQRIGFRLDLARHGGSVEKFVGHRVRALGCASAEQYLERLRTQAVDGEEFGRLVSAITNTHTFFLRDAVQNDVFSRLLRAWRSKNGQPLRVWSAGCATGEEPYSLALLCAEAGVPVQILATDVNLDALEIARAGHYGDWSLRHVPPALRRRHFNALGPSHVVSPAIRACVDFAFHNLSDATTPGGPLAQPAWDWILCRNVLIYFERATVAAIVDRLAGALAPEGLLFFSSTESLFGLGSRLAMVPMGEAMAYRLAAPDAAEGPPDAPPRRPEPPAAQSPALGLAPPATALVHAGADETAARATALAAPPGGPVAARLTRANARLSAHDYAGALEDYGQALEQDPLLAETHYLHGLVLRKLGELERSAHAFRQALFLQPELWPARFMLAGVQRRLGQRDTARANLQQTLSLLEQGAPAPTELFCSFVAGMRDVDLSRADTALACRRLLEP